MSTQGPPEAVINAYVDLMKQLWLTRAVSVAADLALADHLHSGPKTLDELAAATNSHPASLRRLLRALVSEGFFSESSGRYANTEKSDILRKDHQWSLRGVALTQLGQEHYGAWEELLHCVQTGKTGIEKHYGMNIWQYYASNKQHNDNFNASMTSFNAGIENAIIQAYDFSTFKHIMDIGGGHGRLLAQIIESNPSAKGTLFDQPHVLATAPDRPSIQKSPGDFFKAIPPGGDLYLLKFIIHDWADKEAIAILRNIRQVIAPAGKVVLVEVVVPEGNNPDFSKFMDINMLVMTGGLERTATEYGELFAKGGFKLNRVIPTKSQFSIVEASPA